MCAMQSGLFIAGDNGRPPQAHKQKLVTLTTADATYGVGPPTRGPIENNVLGEPYVTSKK